MLAMLLFVSCMSLFYIKKAVQPFNTFEICSSYCYDNEMKNRMIHEVVYQPVESLRLTSAISIVAKTRLW